MREVYHLTIALQHVLIGSVISQMCAHQSQAIEQSAFTKVLVTIPLNGSRAEVITEEDSTVKQLLLLTHICSHCTKTVKPS